MRKDELTIKQQLFVSHYVENGGNGAEAAKKAGYKGSSGTMKSVAFMTLQKVKVKALLDKHYNKIKKKIGATAEAKRSALWDIAQTNMKKTIDIDSGEELMSDPRSAIAAIAELNKMDGDHSSKKVDLTQTYVNQYDELDQKLL